MKIKRRLEDVQCTSDFPSKQSTTHFINEHNLKIEEEDHVFPDEKLFIEWKKKPRVQLRRSLYWAFLVIKKTMKVYSCHQSDSFKSASKGIWHLKTQGSRKINAFCSLPCVLLNRRTVYKLSLQKLTLAMRVNCVIWKFRLLRKTK